MYLLKKHFSIAIFHLLKAIITLSGIVATNFGSTKHMLQSFINLLPIRFHDIVFTVFVAEKHLSTNAAGYLEDHLRGVWLES
jgi:hypothetical protein